jgi:hypothetical protein
MQFSSILPGLVTALSLAIGIDAWAQVRSIPFCSLPDDLGLGYRTPRGL